MAGNPPQGWPPTTPAARSPHGACRPREQCWAPTPTHPHPQHMGGGPQQPAQWAGNQGRDDAPLPHFTRDFFNLLLSSAKPHTAPGFDDTSLYLFSISPPDIQTYIYSLCSLLIADHIPFHWLKAKNFLLYKNGDPHNPTNYRPIALLNTLYKIIASYGAHTLTYYATTYHLTNNTEYSGLPNHRTTDHIYTMIANLSLHPDMYHLYLDLNKAFNSVPHRALWQILSNYNIPHSIINLIQNSYACPHDFPVVNGFALFAAHCIRGLRQGCPMSPILFNLFVDPIINHIQSLLPKQEFNDLFSFIDDIALQTTSHATLHKVPHFLFVQGPRYGPSFNTTKSELHALNNATHITIRIGPTRHFSTFTEAVPRTYGPWPRGLQVVTPVRKPLTPAVPVL